MNKRSLDECKMTLEKTDRNTLERRAERLQELAQIQTDGRLFSSQREWDYAGEASESYISGNYRSTIFCCAVAVEQIFRYEYLKLRGNIHEELERCTFGEVIGKCKKKGVKSLHPFMEQAELLNKMRNEVATHPMFIDLPVEADPERQIRNDLILRDIITLLSLVGILDSKMRHDIESTVLISEAESKKYIFGAVISRQCEMPTVFDGFWGLIEESVLKFLARQAWNIMKTISEGLYGTS